MSDRKIIDGWPALEPGAGFADRVMSRLATAAAPPLAIVREPPSRRASATSRRASSTLLFCAVAVVALLAVPLALHRRTTPARAATVAAGVAPDLGLERD